MFQAVLESVVVFGMIRVIVAQTLHQMTQLKGKLHVTSYSISELPPIF